MVIQREISYDKIRMIDRGYFAELEWTMRLLYDHGDKNLEVEKEQAMPLQDEG